MAHPEWIPRLLRSIDERDWDTFVSHLTEDAEFRYGSGQTAVGRESIRSAADQAVSPFAAVEHELVDVWQRPDSTDPAWWARAVQRFSRPSTGHVVVRRER